jgi:hypothetical protein
VQVFGRRRILPSACVAEGSAGQTEVQVMQEWHLAQDDAAHIALQAPLGVCAGIVKEKLV